MSHSSLHFYEMPAGSRLARLAQEYTTTVLAQIATQLEGLDKSKLRFTHKNGEWRIKPQKGSGPSVTEEFSNTSHSITFPDFGAFVRQRPDTPDFGAFVRQNSDTLNLGEASCFPSENGVFFLACEKALPKTLQRNCAAGKPNALHFGETMIRTANDHYVPAILQGITFHKEQNPAGHRRTERPQGPAAHTHHPDLAVA